MENPEGHLLQLILFCGFARSSRTASRQYGDCTVTNRGPSFVVVLLMDASQKLYVSVAERYQLSDNPVSTKKLVQKLL
jgi:hypothetical protein